jgi:hypothetical protein
MDKEITLFDKNGLKFVKLDKNIYTLQFDIKNNNINLPKIIDFSLLKLIYDLNPDIYDSVNIEDHKENEKIATILMKHFFEDIGISQRFILLHMQKITEPNKITFVSSSIRNFKPVDLPKEAELLDIKTMKTICEIDNPHKIKFHFNIIFDENMKIHEFVENIIGKIINKIFIRVKQFIENIRV